MTLCLKNIQWILWEFSTSDPCMFAENLKIIKYANLSLYNDFVTKKIVKINMI